MSLSLSFLKNVNIPETVITAITSSPTFPEFVEGRFSRYSDFVDVFRLLIEESNSSGELLEKIRDPKRFKSDFRMPLLKLFRRCVSTVVDTEKSKKLLIPSSMFIENYGHTFKDINLLKRQFSNMSAKELYALTSLIGEYDDRGKQGYILTDLFFTWFEDKFLNILSIEGPRGAGKDIQLNSVFENFSGDYPCDFIIRDKNKKVLAVGFARYDSTRGGSQSDDRTGGNNDKVMKAEVFSRNGEASFKVLFISDGPGLTHRDTWEEACLLDGKLNDRVRVSTLKLADIRVTEEWLKS